MIPENFPTTFIYILNTLYLAFTSSSLVLKFWKGFVKYPPSKNLIISSDSSRGAGDLSTKDPICHLPTWWLINEISLLGLEILITTNYCQPAAPYNIYLDVFFYIGIQSNRNFVPEILYIMMRVRWEERRGLIPMVHTAAVSIPVGFFRLHIPGRVESLNISQVNPTF